MYLRLQSITVRLVNVVQRTRKSTAPRSSISIQHLNFSATPDNDDTSQPFLSPTQTSLALSVHFMHPKLGMHDYEILSRASAFLVNVDALEQSSSPKETLQTKKGRQSKSAFPHLKRNKEKRDASLLKQDYAYEPAAGPRRHDYQLNWLEFCPVNFRPRVHVVASSHVLSPWKWPQYYGHEWLKEVNEEHVRYSLEVYGSSVDKSQENDGEEGKLKGSFGPVAKFALNPYPIHHPNGLDVAVIHLKGEDDALENMKEMGIQPLNLHAMSQLESTTDPVFEPGEKVYFHGFEVYESNKVDDDTLSSNDSKTQEDDRIFHPYFASGTQSFGSPDRFLAKTPSPLPEGLCGGPVLTRQHDNNQPLFIRGVVEGIVPPNHENRELAGAASYLPAYRVREFIDFAERIMLEQIVDADVFQRVVDIKERKVESKGTVYGDDQMNSQSNKDDEMDDPNIMANMEGISDDEDTPNIDKAHQEIVSSLHKHHTPEEVNAILATVEREKKEVIEILEKEGGDVDEVIAKVRQRTYEERDRVLKELQEQVEIGDSEVDEAEVLTKEEKK